MVLRRRQGITEMRKGEQRGGGSFFQNQEQIQKYVKKPDVSFWHISVIAMRIVMHTLKIKFNIKKKKQDKLGIPILDKPKVSTVLY